MFADCSKDGRECTSRNTIYRFGWAPQGKTSEDMKKGVNATEETKRKHKQLIDNLEALDEAAADSSEKERAAKRRRICEDGAHEVLNSRVLVEHENSLAFVEECGYLWPIAIFKKHFPDRPAEASMICCPCFLMFDH